MWVYIWLNAVSQVIAKKILFKYKMEHNATSGSLHNESLPNTLSSSAMLFIKKVLYWEWTDCSIPEETPAKTKAEAINGRLRPPCAGVKQVRQCSAGGLSQREIWWFRQTDGLQPRMIQKYILKKRKCTGTPIFSCILKAFTILPLPFEPYVKKWSKQLTFYNI